MVSKKKSTKKKDEVIIIEESENESINKSENTLHNEEEIEDVYYANILEATEIIRIIVHQYYSGKKLPTPYDLSNLEEEYKKLGIYNIYDFARYIINNKMDTNLLLEIDGGKKIKVKNIKFPRY